MSDEQLRLILDRLQALEDRVGCVDTQVDAVEQSLAAMREAQKAKVEVQEKNKSQIRELYWLFGRLERGVQAICCVGTGGMLLIWVAVPMMNDELAGNDEVGKLLLMTAIVCIAYGLLVLTGNERPVLKLLEKLPFLSKN